MRSFKVLGLVFFVVIQFLLIGCSEDSSKDPVNVTPIETLTTVVVPDNNSTINRSAFITITYGDTMQPATLLLTGSMAVNSDGGIWSSTTESNDTLTISPTVLWTVGDRNLTVTVNDSKSNVNSIDLNYTVVAATCNDGIKNQDESDIDCGGATCTQCPDSSSCNIPTDCSSNICTSGICEACPDTDLDGICDATDPCPLDNPDDTDGDGVCDSNDCDPSDPTTYPGATENCYDAIDNDCDATTDFDDTDCSAVCGDSVTVAPEDCDDGGESITCDADCTFAACGDYFTNSTAGEACDDGGESSTCNTDCTSATCGDSITNTTAGETCDDGEESSTCDADCTSAMCGDYLTNSTAGEQCDTGVESSTCNADCTAAVCGDSYINTAAGEECDDGNFVSGDGCSNTCLLEP